MYREENINIINYNEGINVRKSLDEFGTKMVNFLQNVKNDFYIRYFEIRSIEYDFTEEKIYILEKHDDGCHVSIIIYIEKDSDIIDEFYIYNNKIDVDKYGWEEGKALILNNDIHSGTFYHTSEDNKIRKRKIIIIFADF